MFEPVQETATGSPIPRKVARLIAIALFLLAIPSLAASAPPQGRQGPRIDLLRPAQAHSSNGSRRLDIKPHGYEALWRSNRAVLPGFPVPGHGAVELQLVQYDVASGNARFMVHDENGTYEHAGPQMKFFRGEVAGKPGSLVALNLFQGRIGGFVQLDGEEFRFGPRHFDTNRPGAHEVTIRNQRLDEEEPAGRCDGGLHAESTGKLPGPVTEQALLGVDGNTLLKAYIAVEGTVEWVAHHGSVAAAETYTLNLIAQISAYWETDALIRMEVPFSLMHAVENDGYTNGTEDTSVLLSELRSKWRTDPTLQAVTRTATHLFSHRPSGGGSGLAYVDTLCDGVTSPATASDFGVNSISGLGGSWEKRLVGHEIGHSFSSPHTHCYSPEIDQCDNVESGCYAGPEVQTTGTMMSYCDTGVSVIHQRVKDEQIRPAAEAAVPTCIDPVGDPGSVRLEDGNGLSLALPNSCGNESFQTDDGSVDSARGYFGTTQANWVKKFTPSCYPFLLTDVEMLTWSSSAPVGRPIRIVVYVDESGSGDPANSSLLYQEDTTIQVVSTGTWNQYALAAPVIVAAGDMYVGFYDLVADAPDTFIMAYDNSIVGDSFRQPNSTDPAGLDPFTFGTFMIRASGGSLPVAALELSWGAPCNAALVPAQDFAVYQGSMSDFTSYSSLTCSTSGLTSYLLESAPDDAFWLVVSHTTAAEGSYGPATSGEREPAAAACKIQSIGTCP